MHAHAVHLALGGLLIPCTKWRAGGYTYYHIWQVSLTCLVAKETPLLSPPAIRTSELIESFRISEASHGDFYWVFWIRTLYYCGVSVQVRR